MGRGLGVTVAITATPGITAPTTDTGPGIAAMTNTTARHIGPIAIARVRTGADGGMRIIKTTPCEEPGSKTRPDWTKYPALEG
jgi:hypothetical protein